MDHEFKDIIRIKDGKFELIGDEMQARLRLMNYLNDNLFSNIEGIKEGVKRYARDDDSVGGEMRFKEPMT